MTPPCRLKSGKLFTILFANLDNFTGLGEVAHWMVGTFGAPPSRHGDWGGVAGSAGKPWKGMGKSRDKDGCTPDSVPMVFICIYCVFVGILGDEKPHKFPLYRAYIGISHRGMLGSGYIPAYPLRKQAGEDSPFDFQSNTFWGERCDRYVFCGVHTASQEVALDVEGKMEMCNTWCYCDWLRKECFFWLKDIGI